jgi:hypothetical protein
VKKKKKKEEEEEAVGKEVRQFLAVSQRSNCLLCNFALLVKLQSTHISFNAATS